MAEENISQEFKLNKTDETRHYSIEEINRNELMSILNYIEHFVILASTITGCVSVSSFASLVVIPIGITIPAIGLRICAITAGTKS